MNHDDYVYNMASFLESDAFRDRHIVERDGLFVDEERPNLVYFMRIDSSKQIPPEDCDEDDYVIPTIYISDKPRVIHIVGGTKYNSKSWSVDRMNDMAGFEYDYAYLRQCQILGREPFCHWPG